MSCDFLLLALKLCVTALFKQCFIKYIFASAASLVLLHVGHSSADKNTNVPVDPKSDVKPEEEICKKQLRGKRWKVTHFSPRGKKDDSEINSVHPWDR